MKIVLLTALLAVLAGCTWVDVSEEGAAVQLVSLEAAAQCKRLGTTTSVSVEKIAGIKRSEEKLGKELATLARNQAAKMQGNAIAPLGPIEGDQQTFGIYACP